MPRRALVGGRPGPELPGLPVPPRARPFVVGRLKGSSVSLWMARPSAPASPAPMPAAPASVGPAAPGLARPAAARAPHAPPSRSGSPLPALPWRVTGLVAGPVRPSPQPAPQAVAAAFRRRSSASAPAPCEMARPAAATPSASVGTVPAA